MKYNKPIKNLYLYSGAGVKTSLSLKERIYRFISGIITFLFTGKGI